MTEWWKSESDGDSNLADRAQPELPKPDEFDAIDRVDDPAKEPRSPAAPAPVPADETKPPPAPKLEPAVVKSPAPKKSSGDLDGSIGAIIDDAMGDYDEELANLLETLDVKKGEIQDLEKLIQETEKRQVKAFKDLLGSNPQIKKLLQKGNARRKSRRKKAAK